MNLLEHYIKEVYGVKKVSIEGGWSYILVDMTVNCYGTEQRVRHSFCSMIEWAEAKRVGYYMA